MAVVIYSAFVWAVLFVGLVAPSIGQYAFLVFVSGILCWDSFRIAARLEALEKSYFRVIDERDLLEAELRERDERGK